MREHRTTWTEKVLIKIVDCRWKTRMYLIAHAAIYPPMLRRSLPESEVSGVLWWRLWCNGFHKATVFERTYHQSVDIWIFKAPARMSHPLHKEVDYGVHCRDITVWSNVVDIIAHLETGDHACACGLQVSALSSYSRSTAAGGISVRTVVVMIGNRYSGFRATRQNTKRRILVEKIWNLLTYMVVDVVLDRSARICKSLNTNVQHDVIVL